MAIKKIKLPNNSTVDINDARDVPIIDSEGYIDSETGSTIRGFKATNGDIFALPSCGDGNQDNILASVIDLDNYLPLTGGTMSGNIVFAKSGSTTVGYPILALSSITGGWERKLYDVRYDDTRMFHIGVFGSSSTFNYAYLGTNGYNGNNLRIYSDKVQFGDNVIWHAGNANLSTVPWTCSTLTASGNIQANAGVTIANNQSYGGLDTGGTRRTLLSVSNSNGVNLAWGAASAGYNTNISGNNILFTYGTSHTTGMYLNSSGNVGIGTDSPAYKLDVAGNMRVIATGSEFAKFLVYPTNPYGIVFSSESNGTMKIQSRREASAQYFNLVLNPLGGNVGIGTTSPAYKLDVAGVIHASSNVTAGGNITGASFIKTGGTSSQLLAADGSTRSITISSSEPTSSDGSDGDIWIVI